MNGKIFLIVVLLVCASVQLVNSLKCLTCRDLDSCKKPTIVQCDVSNANNIRHILNRYYIGVTDMNSNDFSCFLGRYRKNNVPALEIRGCIMSGTVYCKNYLQFEHELTTDKCIVCDGDNCNSAGSFSSSTTLCDPTAVILMFVFTKIFVV